MGRRKVAVDSLRDAVSRTQPGWRLVLMVAMLAGVVALAPELEATDQQAAAGTPLTSACTARTSGWLQPGLVTVGGAVHVATHIAFSCPEQRQAYHLVLVLDQTLWLHDNPGQSVPERIAALVTALELARNPDVAVGLVAYDGDAEPLCSLTNDQGRLQDCLERLTGTPGSDPGGRALDAALYEARKTLLVGREGLSAAATSPLFETALVVAAPPPEETLAAAVDAASTLRRTGIEVVTVNESPLEGVDGLRTVADPGRAYTSRDWPAILAQQEHRAWSTRLRVREVSVHEFLNRAIQPLPDSADPANPGYDAGRHVLEWVLPLAGQTSIHLSYTAHVSAAGRQPLRQLGYGVFRDSRGLRGAFTLPQPELVVVEGRIQQAYAPLASRFSSGSIKTALSRD